MNKLIITDITIRQDEAGCYCLNDLHRAAVASGVNERTKEPAKFFASPQTVDLVKALTDTQDLGIAPVHAVKGGIQQGTYVCKELVYAYAMWISPVFHLQVIRAYDAMVTAPQHPIPQSLPEALRLAADLADQKAKAEAALALAAPKAAALDRIALETEGAVCLRVAAKLVQVPEKQFTSFLNREGWIFRHHHSNTWQGYSDKEKAGLLELKRTRVTRDDGSEKTVEQVLITPRGQAKAAELIERKAPWLRKVGAAEPPSHPDSPAAGMH